MERAPFRLFREEVVQHNISTIGQVVIRCPYYVKMGVGVIVVIVTTLVTLLFVCDYTKRTQVAGVLQPDRGLVKIRPLQAGRLLKRDVQENQYVRAGEPLFILSSERTTQLGQTSAATVLALRERLSSLNRQHRNLREQHEKEAAASRQRLADLRAQSVHMQGEISSQRQRVALAETNHARHQALERSHFVSAMQVQQRTEEMLEQKGRLSALERALHELKSHVSTVQSEIATQPLRAANQYAELDRDRLALQQALAEAEAQREVVITAPISGTITSIQAELGQMLHGNDVLAAMIPEGSHLVAYFYAPSSSIGFVKPNQGVLLSYHPFPYQKFGQHPGVVTEVSRSAVKPADGLKPNVDPLYRITVRPKKQTVMAYGKMEALQPDMQVEAHILTDRRRLIEWIFEPLLSIKGRI